MNFNRLKNPLFLLACVGLVALVSCSKEEEAPTDTPDNTVPEVYTKIYGATSITSDGTFITIKTNGTPDHKSPFLVTKEMIGYQEGES